MAPVSARACPCLDDHYDRSGRRYRNRWHPVMGVSAGLGLEHIRDLDFSAVGEGAGTSPHPSSTRRIVVARGDTRTGPV